MIFITFPRSGVNFITTAIKYQTGVSIGYQHDFYAAAGKGETTRLIDHSEDYIINIVRDPAESMASWISMQYQFNDEPLIDNGYIKITKAKHIPKYINLYRKLLSYNNVIFIDYADLRDNTQQILNKLYKILNLKANNMELSNIKEILANNMINQEYLSTSKNINNYQDILDTLKIMDLSKCYTLYRKALSRCIKI